MGTSQCGSRSRLVTSRQKDGILRGITPQPEVSRLRTAVVMGFARRYTATAPRPSAEDETFPTVSSKIPSASPIWQIPLKRRTRPASNDAGRVTAVEGFNPRMRRE